MRSAFRACSRDRFFDYRTGRFRTEANRRHRRAPGRQYRPPETRGQWRTRTNMHVCQALVIPRHAYVESPRILMASHQEPAIALPLERTAETCRRYAATF